MKEVKLLMSSCPFVIRQHLHRLAEGLLWQHEAHPELHSNHQQPSDRQVLRRYGVPGAVYDSGNGSRMPKMFDYDLE